MKITKWLFVWLLLVLGLTQLVKSTPIGIIPDFNTFSFNTNSKFVYASVNIPKHASKVFGVFDVHSNDTNSTVFEIDYSSGRDVLTFPVEQLPLSIGNASAYCADIDLSSGFDIEIELNEDSLIVRAKNSRKYILKKKLVPPEKFKILFFFLSHGTYLPQKYTSASSQFIPTTNTIPDEYSYSTERSTRRYVGRVNFVTFKAHRIPKTTPATPPFTTTTNYETDQNDAPETRGGWTSEINSEWSLVFFLLFGAVLVMVVVFILFGLIVFVLLQIRPSQADKHVYADF